MLAIATNNDRLGKRSAIRFEEPEKGDLESANGP